MSYSKHIIFLLILKIIGVLCGKSLTVVVDTTKSMADELNLIKVHIGQVVNSINRTDIDNYILVTFKDARVESPFITSSSIDLLSRINILTATGGGSDCAENSLEGIEAALKASQHQSYIFVFTDAYANDPHRFQNVENLCRESHSQVIMFLSGFCTQSPDSLDVYYDVVKLCSGSFFTFNSTLDLRQAFNFMKTTVNTEWTDIAPQRFINNNLISFSVDSFTSDFVISVSGQSVSTSMTDPKGQHFRSYEKIINTRNAQALYLHQPNPGQYTVSVRGQGTICVTFYERNYIPFLFGFSSKTPRSLRETSLRPIAGWSNYVLISIDKSIALESLEWLNSGDNVKSVIYLEKKGDGLYLSGQHMVEPGKSFRLWVIGTDIETNRKIRGSTEFIYPQLQVNNPRVLKPEVEILDTENNLIDFGTEFTLGCKVSGFPKPSIRWEDSNGDYFYGEDILLEIPAIHISYFTISNVTDNSTWYCKSENYLGTASHYMDIFVNRTFTFDVVESPEDTSVKYGENLTLSCQVDAYPEAKISWTMNGTELYTPKAVIDGNTLSVRNVGIEDGGSYECVASNAVETQRFTAEVFITGLETPVVDIEKTEIDSKPGDRISVECRAISGNPAPQITWQFQSSGSFDFEDIPYSASVYNDKLVISYLEKNNGGTYRCKASNIIGEDSKEVTINIQIPPTITSNVTTISVREEHAVYLPCAVEAAPAALVRWEMSQDDVIVPLTDRHITDDKHTLRFIASWNDSGSYHCIAENSVGRAQITITLNVLVPTYIEPPKSDKIRVKYGLPLDLPCVVLYGNPPPTLQWTFTPVDSVPRTIARGNTTLHIDSVSPINEGTYQCVAVNEINSDNIKYTLKVHN